MSSESTGAIRFNLLGEPLLRWRALDGREQDGSLPELLAGLCERRVASFPRLRAHQTHPWHAFLVQLAALALDDGGRPETDVPTSGDEWRALLLCLTDNDFTPWCLVVGDIRRPAFLQPPFGGTGEPWPVEPFTTPDAVDVLVTSRNHDVKMGLIQRSLPEHWVHALVCAQTSGGYEGPGIRRTVRMYGGYGARLGVSTAPSLDASACFLHDLGRLMRLRGEVAETFGYDLKGHRLLWMLPWNWCSKNDKLPLLRCHPWFIEVSRAIRLGAVGEDIVASRWSRTKGFQVPDRLQLPKSLERGYVGDPWLPIVDAGKEGFRAFNLTSRGFDFSRVTDLLFGGGGSRLPICADFDRCGRGDRYVIFRGLARRQGGTEGYHERILPVPLRVMGLLASGGERERLGQLARERVRQVDALQGKVLEPALRVLMGNGSRSGFRDYADLLRQAVDAVFFEDLWRHVDLDPSEASMRWLQRVEPIAWRLLVQAPHSLPVPLARRYRLEVAARSTYHKRLFKEFETYARLRRAESASGLESVGAGDVDRTGDRR